jgi:PAS domain S-box-containing protein
MKNEHEAILDAAKTQFQMILEESKQGIYLYLDDTHKLCNKKFASMLGYASAEEWESVEKPFTDAFVEPQSQHALVSAYQEAMESKTGSCVNVTCKRKMGGQVNTQVMLVPIRVKGAMLAMHFMSSI